LNTHILSERCFGFGITLCLHPHSGWFIVSNAARFRLPKGLNKRRANDTTLLHNQDQVTIIYMLAGG
jgi:hypothetical protein